MTTFTDRATWRPAQWLARNVRAAGVGTALVVFLVLALGGRPPADLLETLVVIIPALQAAFFAFVVAIAMDDPDVPPGAATLRDFGFWFGVAFIAIWVIVIFTQASIDAYVRFGMPPVIGGTL